jgi:hypothetical protein
MMTGDKGIALETDSLARASADLAPVVEEIGRGLDRLRAALDGQADALGDEVVGPFAQEYLPLLGRAVTAITSYQEQIRYASTELAAAAEVLATKENLDAESMARLLPKPWLPTARE